MGAYKLWHEFVKHFPKTSRYTLGAKIDTVFIELLETLFRASHQKEKYILIVEANIKLDILKFLIRMSWEIKSLDNKKYIMLSKRLEEVGLMLGGWKKYSLKKSSA